MCCCAVCVRYGVYLRVNTVQSFTHSASVYNFEFITYNFGNINIQMTSAILGIPDKLSWWQQTVKD